MRKRRLKNTTGYVCLNYTVTPEHPVRHWALELLVVHGGMETYFLDTPVLSHLGLAPTKKISMDEFENGALQEFLHRHWQALIDTPMREDALPAALLNNTRLLGETLGASACEIKLLRFAILLHADPALNIAAGCVDSITPMQCVRILASLLNESEANIDKALAEGSAMARAELYQFNAESQADSLRDFFSVLSPSFARNMLTMQEFDSTEIFKGVFQPCQAPSLRAEHYSHMRHEFAILRELLREAISSQRSGVNVLLYGEPGTGKTELSRLMVQLAGVPGYEVCYENDSGHISDGVRRIRAWITANVMLQNQATMLIFDEAEDAFVRGDPFFSIGEDDRRAKGWMSQALENNAVPTLWLVNHIDRMEPAYIRRFDLVLEVKQPTRAQRRIMAEGMVGHLASPATLECMAGHAHLSPAIMQRVGNVTERIHHHAQRAKRHSKAHGERLDPADSEKTLIRLMDETLRAQGHKGLDIPAHEHARSVYDPAHTQADTDLHALAQHLSQRHASARICLYGPPGTGKTAYAQWLAEQADRPLLLKKASDLLNPFVGGTERNMAQAFREASDEGALLLIDEVDSFLQERSKARNGWEVSMVNEMLTQMERFEGVFIASTNLMDGLDPASLRRFDLKIRFDYLRPEQVRRLFARWCKTLGLHAGVTKASQSVLSLEIVTPGDFAALARQHRFKPFATAGALAEGLIQECGIKSGLANRRIGFL